MSLIRPGYSIIHIEDEIWAVDGPGLQQPQFITGRDNAERRVEELADPNRPKPAEGQAHFEAVLEIT